MNHGERFYAFELLKGLAGRSVAFEREVYRGIWTISKGARGILMAPCHDTDGMIFAAVKLDDPPPGLAEQYDGEIHWVEGISLDDIEQDLLVLPQV